MDPAEQITVTVAYALPERQSVISLDLPLGVSAGEAVQHSGLLQRHPELESRPLKLAIFGRIVPASAPLKVGDRVEILRPLARNPQETRRNLAARGRTMGKGVSRDE